MVGFSDSDLTDASIDRFLPSSNLHDGKYEFSLCRHFMRFNRLCKFKRLVIWIALIFDLICVNYSLCIYVTFALNQCSVIIFLKNQKARAANLIITRPDTKYKTE